MGKVAIRPGEAQSERRWTEDMVWIPGGNYVIVAAQAVIGEFLASFKDYPPSQRAQSFSIDQIVEKMQRSLSATQSQ